MQDPDDIRRLVGRALAHYAAKGTDQADATMTMPIGAYLDPDRFATEVDAIFGHLPLAMALSLELPEPRSFRTLEVMETPVLLTRDDHGVVRAFLNVCRHRGAQICQEEEGSTARFTCPYHGWSYDNDGTLVGIYGASVFGEVDRTQLGLTELPCAERSGLVWVSLDPEAVFDIDDWLGDFAPELDTLDLEHWHVLDRRQLVGSPGWKVAWDGYLESYHHKFVHPDTVGMYTVPNLLLHDAYGPHQRIVFARKELSEIADVPESEWVEPERFIRQIHSGFPNLSISGILGDHCLVSQVYPGPTPATTITQQTVLAAKEPLTSAEKEASETFSTMVLAAVRDEDYAIGATIQQALGSGANHSFTFGRNEIAVQHWHRHVAHYTQEATGVQSSP